MKSFHPAFFLGIMGMLAMLGCREGTPTAYDLPYSATNYSFVGHLGPIDNYGELSDDVKRQYVRDGIEAIGQLREIVANSNNWSEAHQRVMTELAAPSAAYQPHREQVAATLMLTTYLLEREGDPSLLPATAHYTELLTRNRSPEVVLIADAIDRLKGYWPETKRAAVAAEAAAVGDSYLAQRLDCIDCSAEGLLRRLNQDTRAREDRFLIEAANAIQTLRTLSVAESTEFE